MVIADEEGIFQQPTTKLLGENSINIFLIYVLL